MVRISELMGGGFAASRGAVRAGATELVEAGGRGSGKSSYLSLELLLQLLKHPGCHAVVVRKVASTLRNSAYRQLQWAISALGADGKFRCGISPMEMEYLPTGQKILFFGMDDDGKLKSLKMPFGHVGLLWFEELDQFTAEEVRSVEQSVLRGGDFSLTLKSFNPPADPKHWANLYFLEKKEGNGVTHWRIC
jgi:PBSX family phage terminase large subunit